MGRIVALPTAKLAKERGFNLRCPGFYGCDKPAGGGPGNQYFPCDWVKASELGQIDSQDGTMIYNAPEQEMLKEWLREVHSFHVEVKPLRSREGYVIWSAQVYTLKRFNKTFQSFEYCSIPQMGQSYEDALELGILDALKLLPIDVKIVKRYKCLLCGRDKFTRKSPHNCVGGYRKHHIQWEALYE